MIYIDNIKPLPCRFFNKREDPPHSLVESIGEMARSQLSLSPIAPLKNKRNFIYFYDRTQEEVARVLKSGLDAIRTYLETLPRHAEMVGVEHFTPPQKMALAKVWRQFIKHSNGLSKQWLPVLKLNSPLLAIWYYREDPHTSPSEIIKFTQLDSEGMYFFFKTLGKEKVKNFFWSSFPPSLPLEQRIELAHLAKSVSPLRFIASIDRFDLPQQLLVSFASELLLLPFTRMSVANAYRLFKIEDPQHRLQHAREMMREASFSPESFRCIPNFDLPLPHKETLVREVLSQNPSLLTDLFSSGIFEESPWVSLAKQAEIFEDQTALAELFTEQFSEKLGQNAIDTLLDIRIWSQKKAAIRQICSFFLSFSFLENPKAEHLDLVNKIVALKSAQLRPLLLDSWVMFLKMAGAIDLSEWVSFSTSFKLAETYPSWASAIRCPLAHLELQKVDVRIAFEILEKWYRESKDLEKFKAFVHFLLLLASAKELSSEQKSALLLTLAKDPKPHLFSQLKQLCFLLQMGEASRIAALVSSGEIGNSLIGEEFFPLCLTTFGRLFDEPISPDLAMQVFALFERYRIPSVLITYLINLSDPNYQDREPHPLKIFGKHILSLLRGSYRTERYSREANPHLALISPAIVQKWSENSAEPIGDGLWIVETDDPEDLLLGASEEHPTCLKISSSPFDHNNFGLLGHLGNGQTRMIAIKKEEEGPVYGRATLKLLLTEDNQPILLIDSIHCAENAKSFYVEQILKKGLQKAQALGCPLATRWMKRSDLPKFSLFSRGGPVPYDYCDSPAGDLLESAEFEVSDVSLIESSDPAPFLS